MSLKELLNLIKTHESVEMIFNNLNISYKVNERKRDKRPFRRFLKIF